MAPDSEVLLNHPIPEARQRHSWCDSALYALTFGLGGDPLGECQLAYVDPCHDLQASPRMALVPGHPGFWLDSPATDVDALRLVHGEQRLEWRRPLLMEGEVIGRVRVTSLVDKGADKGALPYSEKAFNDALSDEVLAAVRNTTFLRGDDGFGGSRQVSEMPHRLPERTPDLRLDLPTRSEQALYHHLNGDDNPFHAEPTAALRVGFPRPTLYGLCALGVILHTVLRGLVDYRTEQLGRLQVRFSTPVFPGETLRTEMRSDGPSRTRAVERDVVVLGSGQVGPPPERPN